MKSNQHQTDVAWPNRNLSTAEASRVIAFLAATTAAFYAFLIAGFIFNGLTTMDATILLLVAVLAHSIGQATASFISCRIGAVFGAVSLAFIIIWTCCCLASSPQSKSPYWLTVSTIISATATFQLFRLRPTDG